MVGLPNAGKSTWVKKYMETHPEKHHNIIGINGVLERCKVSIILPNTIFYCI